MIGEIKRPTMHELEEHLEVHSLAEQPIAGYMRLHHFLYSVMYDFGASDDSFAKLALMGEGDDEVEHAIHIQALNWVKMRGALRRDPAFAQSHDVHYHHDVIADWSFAQIKAWMRETADEMRRWSWLGDDAVLKFGSTPDVSCMKCAIGEHCNLLDIAKFSAPGEPNTQTTAREQEACDDLLNHLRLFDIVEGRDYITGHETIILRDGDGQLVEAEAPYMLITLGMVRNLLTG